MLLEEEDVLNVSASVSLCWCALQKAQELMAIKKKLPPASLHCGKVWRSSEPTMVSSRDIHLGIFSCVITHRALCVMCALGTVLHWNLASNGHSEHIYMELIVKSMKMILLQVIRGC